MAWGCPLCSALQTLVGHCAMSGKCRHKRTHALQQHRPYSITLSARAISVCDTSIPRSFAVFRLIKRLNLVGCPRWVKNASFCCSPSYIFQECDDHAGRGDPAVVDSRCQNQDRSFGSSLTRRSHGRNCDRSSCVCPCHPQVRHQLSDLRICQKVAKARHRLHPFEIGKFAA
jgi:hypothetical protein